MKSPLNDFILDLLNFRKDPKVMEKKLDLLRDQFFEEKQKLEEQKLRYLQQYEQPRTNYENALALYLEKVGILRAAHKKNPGHKGALQDWLKEAANPPETLRNKPSQVFSYLP